MAKNSRIARIRTLYAVLIGLVALFIVLFILNVVSAADPIAVANLSEQNKDYGILITDLQPQHDRLTAVVGLDDSLSATVHTATFDVSLASDSEHLVTSGKATWCLILQIVSILAFVIMIILAVITLISFYINVRRGKVFPKKNIRWLTWAGILMIVMTRSIDAATWIEQSLAANLLAGTDWEPTTNMPIHFGRIVFGLTIIFMAQIFYYGREIQEEQELTI